MSEDGRQGRFEYVETDSRRLENSQMEQSSWPLEMLSKSGPRDTGDLGYRVTPKRT